MQTVKVTKTALLEKLKANRIVHEEEYNEMMEVYLDQVIEGLEGLLEEAKKRNSNSNMYLNITKPTSFIKDYDMIIGMLEMSTEDEFVITQNEYRKFVLNEWDWTNQFNMFKAAYTA